MTESYRTIHKTGESLLKEKGSKFYGYAVHVRSLEEVKEALVAYRKMHHAARHWCYAYRLGTEGEEYRSNDDGEPNHSAGDPILRQITGKDLTYTLVVVVRYFGGTKLGVGGLIQAYGGAGEQAIDAAVIKEHAITERIRIEFDYPDMAEVMRLLKKYEAPMVKHEFTARCWVITETPRAVFDAFEQELIAHHTLRLKRL